MYNDDLGSGGRMHDGLLCICFLILEMEHTCKTQTREGIIILSLEGKDRIKDACLDHICCLLILCTLSTIEPKD